MYPLTFFIALNLFSSFAQASNSCSANGEPPCIVTCQDPKQKAVCIDGNNSVTFPTDPPTTFPGFPGNCYCVYEDSALKISSEVGS